MGLTLPRNELIGRVEGLRGRSARDLAGSVRARFGHVNEAYGLRRDLSVPFAAPQARLPLTVRALEDRDVDRLLDPHASGIDPAESDERRSRLAILRAGLETAYVAVTDDDEPAYVQWLLGPDQDELVARHFRGIFPRTAPGEALLEGAYTPVAFRGKRVMPCAMARIAELGRTVGARYVHTFVTTSNGASLAGCERSGFAPYVLRRTEWRALRHTVTFTDLPSGGAPPTV